MDPRLIVGEYYRVGRIRLRLKGPDPEKPGNVLLIKRPVATFTRMKQITQARLAPPEETLSVPEATLLEENQASLTESARSYLSYR